jgi:hypothetical protein
MGQADVNNGTVFVYDFTLTTLANKKSVGAGLFRIFVIEFATTLRRSSR